MLVQKPPLEVCRALANSKMLRGQLKQVNELLFSSFMASVTGLCREHGTNSLSALYPGCWVQVHMDK